MTHADIFFLIGWYIIGFAAVLTIMIVEDGWTPKDTTILDILCLILFPAVGGPLIWIFYGLYLLLVFGVLDKPLFKKAEENTYIDKPDHY